MNIEIFKNHISWNSQISKYSDLLFYKYEWYCTFKEFWHKSLLLRFDNSLLPLQINFFNKNAYSGPWGSYGGPVGEEKLDKKTAEILKKRLNIKKLYLFCERPLKYLKEKETAYSVEIPLSDPDSVMGKISDNRRRNLKKALKENLRLEMERGQRGAERYLRFLKKALRDTKTKYQFHPLFLFKRLAKIEGSFFFFVVKEKEDLSSALVLGLNNDILYFWHGSNTLTGLQTHASDRLHFEIMKLGFEKNFKKYNLGTSPTPELLKYKLSWGGVQKPVFIYEL